ncbi:MAG TPA: thiamine phosphate synthase [Terriglobia bacterium]|nr:thiamine phosphate synthase [Terriglobia bacterium]
MAFPPSLPRLYAILDVEQIGAGSTEQVCESLLGAGVRLLQYRHKRGSSREMFEGVRRLIPMIHDSGGLLIVNDRADVALVAGADGVHLGQDDLPVGLARRVLKPGRWLGCSTHNLDQLRIADASPADYLAFGPIFPTSSKDTPDPTVGLAGLAEARRATSKPLVAIGGITVSNARRVMQQGADFVAVISGLLAAPDVADRAREYLDALSE